MASLFASAEKPEPDPRESAASMPDGLALSHLVVLKVPVSWQEAVAVVLETAHDLPPLASFPDLSDVTLTSIGEVHRRSTRGVSGSPVLRAAELLRDLLRDASAPAELKAVIEQNVTDPPAHASLAAFVTALGYFERPNRRADVAAVYGRGFALLQSSATQQELERLRTKVARDQKAKSAEQSWRVRWGGPLGQLGLAIALCIIIAVSGYTLISMALGPVTVARDDGGAPLEAERPTVAETMSAAGERLKELVIAGLSLTGTAGETTTSPTTPTKRARRQPAAAEGDEWVVSVRDVTATFLADENEATSAAGGTVTSDSSPASEAAPLPSKILGRTDMITGPLFSASDFDVFPATLVKPKLPSVARDIASPDNLAVLELVVNEEGIVDSAKLTGPSQRINDKMLVAAAKAWIFDPARLNGQPVRYLLRIQITE